MMYMKLKNLSNGSLQVTLTQQERKIISELTAIGLDADVKAVSSNLDEYLDDKTVTEAAESFIYFARHGRARLIK